MHKKIGVLLLTVVMLLSFTACGGEDAAAADETLTIASSGDAIALDPVATNDNQSSNVMVQLYEGLVSLAEDGSTVPNLAESVEQPDDVTYVFKLKEGVKFHNGEELKASDVVFSLKRACEAPNVRHLFNTIDPETIKANDDYTVEFKLIRPYTGILAALCHPGGFIVNEKAVTEGGDSYAQNPVGTGAVKFVSWRKADSIVLERFEDYHGEKTAYKTLTYRIIPEATNRLIELESGGVDVAYDIAPNDLEKVEGNDKLALLRSFDYGTTYLGFNTQKAPFDNEKVREAVSYAIDMDAIIKAVWHGVGRTASSPMPPTLTYSVADDMQPKTRDIEKAKELLKEAGFENGFETTISTNDRKQRIDMATIIKEQLSEVGIDVSINVLEWSAFNDLIKNGQQDMFEIAWIADSPDPDTFLFPCFHSSAKGEGGNYIYLEDAELDGILEQARELEDGPERAELYKQAQERIIDITAWVPQYNGELLVGTSANIENLELSPFGWYNLREVTKSAAQ